MFAAGFSFDWSTTRLLITRGCESATNPDRWMYDVGPSGAGPGGSNGSPCRYSWLSSSRGKTWSAAPNRSCPGIRLLKSPLTVRSPYGSSGLETWFGPVPEISPPAAWCSARLIWSRMNSRSCPFGSTARAAPGAPASIAVHTPTPSAAFATRKTPIGIPTPR